jgi:hypothetical protein
MPTHNRVGNLSSGKTLSGSNPYQMKEKEAQGKAGNDNGE